MKGGEILPRIIIQVLLEESEIMLMIFMYVFLKVIEIKLLVTLPL